MSNFLNFYVDGAWMAPAGAERIGVIDPATEETIAEISAGTAADVDRAVAAARRAFETFGDSTKEERLSLLRRIRDVYGDHRQRIGDLISQEMGAPLEFARKVQAGTGLTHLDKTIEVLERYEFEHLNGTTMVRREPIGVAGLITPWNWPINQIVCKVLPALAAGCTMVLKPSELSPLSAIAFAEVLHEAGIPAGVFNLVNGTGETVGEAISAHPGVDMISLTGSTRAGVAVSRAAAATVKRVTLELGGKAPNILLPDVDFEDAVTRGVLACMRNSGQSCSAPTRMLVPAGEEERVEAIAARVAAGLRVGDPAAQGVDLGPVISRPQFDKIQGLIQSGIDEGARLVAGGPGRPDGLNRGYYVRPTVFGGVTPDMRIAREEIFGPVLSILPYADEEDAVRIANDTVYGLTAYVQSGDPQRARLLARRIRAGSVLINYAPVDSNGPFGGYKQSGNGREYGEFGLEEFLEVKGMVGYGPA
ncbi:aldehyde dehydrogenase family protein [Rhizobiaceae bacterium BDR2-2]|uniref:Aldehyde dehydrogenase family protein n=1 Tax=Ectorhizobium quercum TaxID=2965071 RepID=A0AAE3N144_9HYPH|nr:aldehyde dehydrogenase family protein [Ectorhizobium quercum]MCX8997380.1 aldehyde dehydrogenase family protein [Ectorhizobium quercum]